MVERHLAVFDMWPNLPLPPHHDDDDDDDDDGDDDDDSDNVNDYDDDKILCGASSNFEGA